MGLFGSKKSRRDISDLIAEKESGTIEVERKIQLKGPEKAIEVPAISGDSLQELAAVKDFLQSSLQEYTALADAHGFDTDMLKNIQQRLKDERFTIVVLGEFSRGKSTFINAMLGNVILPANILPTTAVVTLVDYSEQPYVDITKHSGEQLKIPAADLIQYVTSLNDDLKKQSDAIAEAHVYYPSEICRFGCTIVDTPGVNDINETNNKVTYDFLPKADAAIILLDPQTPLTKSERAFITTKVMSHDISKLFFVVNKADTITNLPDVMEYLKEQIPLMMGNGSVPRLYAVSSKSALLTRRSGRQDGGDQAFKNFEKELSRFLTSEKGYVLYSSALTQFQRKISQDIELLRGKSALLDQSMDSINEKIKEFVHMKAQMHSEQSRAFSVLEQESLDFRQRVTAVVDSEMQKISTDAFQQIKFTGNSREIPSYLNKRTVQFVDETLTPMLENEQKRMQQVIHSFEQNAQNTLTNFTQSISIRAGKMNVGHEAASNISTRLSVKQMGVAGLGIAAAAFFLTPFSLPIAAVAGVLGSGALAGIFSRLSQRKESAFEEDLQQVCRETAAQINIQVQESLDSMTRNIKQSVVSVFESNVNSLEASLTQAKLEKSKQMADVQQVREKLEADIRSMGRYGEQCGAYLESLPKPELI